LKLQVAERNRGIYRKLRRELQSLTEGGVYLARKMQEEGANMMQKLAVDILCTQLDETWNCFTQTFRMQDKIYVQFVELYQFENEFRELVNKFSENEKIINRLIMTGFGNSLEEISKELEECDNLINALSVDESKAVGLARAGRDLMLEHPFTRESLEYSCAELKVMLKKQEILFEERRRPLVLFHDLYQALDRISEWTKGVDLQLRTEVEAGTETEEKTEKLGDVSALEPGELLEQLRQFELLLAGTEQIKIRDRQQFETDFLEIKDLISEKTLLQVDEGLGKLEERQGKVRTRRDLLKQRATEEKLLEDSSCADSGLGLGLASSTNGIDQPDRREKIVAELIATEETYVADLATVISGYKEKMAASKIASKTEQIFGNIEEIQALHNESLLPELRQCGARADFIAETFLNFSGQLTRAYCKYCQNMEDSHAAVTDIGENHPLLVSCQKALGHQLPLSSYLLKPMQRLTKYQLLLKDLLSTASSDTSPDLASSIEAILVVIKAVNDSMHQSNIRGLPEVLHPLGSLVQQETFSVLVENRNQPSNIFKNRRQSRQVLLYDSQLVFCKQTNEKRGPVYHFKFSLAITSLGMSSIIKGAERKIEIWIIGQTDVYSLEAKNKKAKEDFAAELRRVIIEQKDKVGAGAGGDGAGACLAAEGAGQSGHRSQSLDLTQDREAETGQPELYRVLADYSALSDRELSLQLGEMVQLVKVGCAGWWFVRLTSYPDTEGWAPETYLERVPGRHHTLDRI